MSIVVMHVWPIQTHCLLFRDPRGTYFSMHSSTTCDTTLLVNLVNKICRGARHVSRNGTSFLISYLSSIHTTLITTMSQNQCKWNVHTNNEEITIFIKMHDNTIVIQHQQLINKSFKLFSTHHTPIINYIAFYYPFSSLKLFNMDKSNHHQIPITSQHIPPGIHDSIHLTMV